MSKKPHVDDDLDDLDDVLENWSTSSSVPASSPPRPDADAHEALMSELAKEMELVFNGLGKGSHSEQPDGATAWEAMLVEEMKAMSGPSDAHDASSSNPNEFLSRIHSTMNKRKQRESSLKSADPTANGGDESLDSLLQDLLAGDTGSEEEIHGMLETLMGQLMSKDVLYEPLKELHEKFPGYLTEHAGAISPEDKARYVAQMSCIKRLLAVFEDKIYRDGDEKSRGEIVDLMSELQSHGSPPAEIMGALPPGFSLGEDGLPDAPDGCNMN